MSEGNWDDGIINGAIASPRCAMAKGEGASADGVFKLAGKGAFLRFNPETPLEGDFVARTRMLFESINGTAAAIVLWYGDKFEEKDFIGFDGAGKKIFYEGGGYAGHWGKPTTLGPAPAAGKMLDIVLSRTAGKLTVTVDGAAVMEGIKCDWTVTGVGYRPWRNAFQVESLQIQVRKRNKPLRRGCMGWAGGVNSEKVVT